MIFTNFVLNVYFLYKNILRRINANFVPTLGDGEGIPQKNKGIGLVAVMIVIINMDNFCQYQYSCSDFGVKICRFDDKCFFLSQETDKILPICNFV